MECISNAGTISPNAYLYVYIVSEFQSKPQIMVEGKNDAVVLRLNRKSVLFRVTHSLKRRDSLREKQIESE